MRAWWEEHSAYIGARAIIIVTLIMCAAGILDGCITEQTIDCLNRGGNPDRLITHVNCEGHAP